MEMLRKRYENKEDIYIRIFEFKITFATEEYVISKDKFFVFYEILPIFLFATEEYVISKDFFYLNP